MKAPLIVLGILISLWIIPVDAITQNLSARLNPPSLHYYLGTDEFGRDLFSRIVRGTRTSVYVSFLSSGTAVFLGLILGLTGAMRKRLSPFLLLLSDIMLSVPAIILVLLCISLLGSGSLSLIIALSVVYLPLCIRLAYVQAKHLINNEFVIAGYSFGASRWWIGVRHIVRPLVAVFSIQWSTLMATSIQIEASLSFLGVGIRLPEPSLGLLLRDAQRYSQEAPWLFIFPGTVLVGIVGALFFVVERAKRQYH